MITLDPVPVPLIYAHHDKESFTVYTGKYIPLSTPALVDSILCTGGYDVFLAGVEAHFGCLGNSRAGGQEIYAVLIKPNAVR